MEFETKTCTHRSTFVIYIQIAVLMVVLCLISTNAYSTEAVTHQAKADSALLLDFELLGDTSIESLQASDQVLLTKISDELSKQIKLHGLFQVVDDEASLAQLNEASKTHYLHRCNGCELDLAQKLGARVVLAPWVYRMSVLLQAMHIEIRDVDTGKILLKKAYDFRGNSDEAWQRAMRYMVRDLKKLAQANPS